MKKIYFLFALLFLVGCSSNAANLDPNDYEQSLEFISNNFEVNYDNSDVHQEDYFASYDTRNISDDIIMHLNASGQIVAIQFENLTAEESMIVLEDLDLPIDEDLDLLLSNVGEFKNELGQNFLAYTLEDEVGVHILGFEDEVAEKMNRDGQYNVNVFYNLNLYNDFLIE